MSTGDLGSQGVKSKDMKGDTSAQHSCQPLSENENRNCLFPASKLNPNALRRGKNQLTLTKKQGWQGGCDLKRGGCSKKSVADNSELRQERATANKEFGISEKSKSERAPWSGF